ncbi:MAG: CAP domain-containing protein [Halocynthiibacter sp.]
MARVLGLLFVLLFALAACETTTLRLGPDGKPLPQVYRIGNAGKVQLRMLDAVNALRQAGGVGQVQLNSALTAAAATHSRDMSVQNRPWHFGSDGSSPLDRIQRAGFRGQLVGENISETYESEIETLAAWMQQPDTRETIMDPKVATMGFSWFQDPNGKIWWTMVTGTTETLSAPESPAVQG